MSNCTTKPCTRCGAVKSFGEFHKRAASPDGLQPMCRACEKTTKAERYLRNREVVRAKQREYYVQNAETITARVAEWQAQNPERIREGFRRRYAANPDGQRNRQLKCSFNITLAEYNAMLEAQGGVCAICGQSCKSGRNLAVDHDHACCPGKKSCGGCIRGLLCRDCNVTLGRVSDDPGVLRRAADYLEEHRGL